MKSTAEIIDEIERERQKRYIAAVITYGYLKKLKKRFNGKKPPTIEVCRELMAETVNKTDPKLLACAVAYVVQVPTIDLNKTSEIAINLGVLNDAMQSLL